MMKGVATRTAVAGMILVAVVVNHFADGVVPAHFMVRPLITVPAIAVVIGLASSIAGRRGVPTAGAAALLVAFASVSTVLSLLGVAIVLTLLGRRGLVVDVRRSVIWVAAVFAGLSLMRAVPLLDLSAPPAVPQTRGTPIYLILLDGYPRNDTLSQLGIDNQPFVDELSERGFDYYPDARSDHENTGLALTSMLTGSPVTRAEWDADMRAIRSGWSLPPGFVAIAPPVGAVTMPNAATIASDGMNDFEAGLLGNSVFHLLPWSGDFITESLRDRLDTALEAIATTEHRRIFAHLGAPHPPFLFEVDGTPRGISPCWPRACHIFTNVLERLRIGREEWAAGMEGNLNHLNPRLLAVVDRVLERHPDAMIVLFSDHGGRISLADREEWHRSFLAARTPARPRMLADDPGPDAVFDVVMDR